jgi:hypothetical protein
LPPPGGTTRGASATGLPNHRVKGPSSALLPAKTILRARTRGCLPIHPIGLHDSVGPHSGQVRHPGSVVSLVTGSSLCFLLGAHKVLLEGRRSGGWDSASHRVRGQHSAILLHSALFARGEGGIGERENDRPSSSVWAFATTSTKSFLYSSFFSLSSRGFGSGD